MESLIKQTGVRYSGVGPGNKEEIGSVRDRTVPPLRSQSFKGEKRKSQNWFQNKFSDIMNQNADFRDDDEYPAAVAAAAFAIRSLEESDIQDQKKAREGPATSLSKTKTRKDDKTTHIVETGRASTQFTDRRVPIGDDTSGKKPEKLAGPAPSIKKAPTSEEELRSSAKPRNSAPKPDIPSTKQSAFPPNEVRRQNPAKPGDTKADAWEKAQLDTIKKRYDKLNFTILDWENKKKMKAKRKLDQTESELERRRAKAMQHYRSKIGRVDQVAVGARTQAEKNQKNEELKVKEKANKIRSTGKFPASCFCF